MRSPFIRAAAERLAVALLVLLPTRVMADEPVVLFDDSHGQRFLIDREEPLHFSDLASVLRQQGLQAVASRQPLTGETLQGTAALVISGAFQPIGPQEIQAILQFVKGGGRMCIMLHIGPPAAELLRQLGVSISNGVIRETEGVVGEVDINFAVSRLHDHELFKGIESFYIYGAWALMAHGHHAGGIAGTGPSSWVDLNGDREFDQGDALQEFSVIVEGGYGKGRFVVFGDDAMFQNQFLQGNNRTLAENLALWLGGKRLPGERQQIARHRIDTSHKAFD